MPEGGGWAGEANLVLEPATGVCSASGIDRCGAESEGGRTCLRVKRMLGIAAASKESFSDRRDEKAQEKKESPQGDLMLPQ